ncbi:MAG: phage tail protein [Burkholderiales bacterium]
MSEAFISEIRIYAFNFPPRNWATCDGQILSIAQNSALFSLLGTTFGGDGRTTFALPDLRGRSPTHWGTGPGLSTRSLGERSGEQSHTLITSEMPQHTHAVGVVNKPGTATSASGNLLAAHRGGYAEAGNTNLGAGAVDIGGGSQAHENMAPYLVLNFCICIAGIFPSRS